MEIILNFILAFLVSSFLEYIIHRYVLHNKLFPKIFKYHFGRHHGQSRRLNGIDPDYFKFPKNLKDGLFEILGIIFLNIIFIPFYFLDIWFFGFIISYSWFYYFIHRYFHIYPDFFKKILPWHWDHHMGKNQNINWGITNPIFDLIFRTRVYEERRHRKRN